jgi:hypothetical protein
MFCSTYNNRFAALLLERFPDTISNTPILICNNAFAELYLLNHKQLDDIQVMRVLTMGGWSKEAVLKAYEIKQAAGEKAEFGWRYFGVHYFGRVVRVSNFCIGIILIFDF